MSWYEILLGVFLMLSALIIILVILLQQGSRAGIAGAISGGAETFLSKNKARSVDAKLARWTKYICIFFILVAVLANALALLIK